MKRAILTFAALAALASPAAGAQYSKLGIITAAKQIGKWDALKAWIASAGYADEWQACSYLADDYPQYAAITNAVVSQGIVSAEEIAGIIAASVDTAVPDAMLKRVVETDCKTSSGRVKWHGALVSQVIDEEAETKTETYADGAVFVFPYKPPAKKTPGAAVLDKSGIPARLAAARARRAAEAATTNEVQVIIQK